MNNVLRKIASATLVIAMTSPSWGADASIAVLSKFSDLKDIDRDYAVETYIHYSAKVLHSGKWVKTIDDVATSMKLGDDGLIFIIDNLVFHRYFDGIDRRSRKEDIEKIISERNTSAEKLITKLKTPEGKAIASLIMAGLNKRGVKEAYDVAMVLKPSEEIQWGGSFDEKGPELRGSWKEYVADIAIRSALMSGSLEQFNLVSHYDIGSLTREYIEASCNINKQLAPSLVKLIADNVAKGDDNHSLTAQIRNYLLDVLLNQGGRQLIIDTFEKQKNKNDNTWNSDYYILAIGPGDKASQYARGDEYKMGIVCGQSIPFNLQYYKEAIATVGSAKESLKHASMIWFISGMKYGSHRDEVFSRMVTLANEQFASMATEVKDDRSTNPQSRVELVETMLSVDTRGNSWLTDNIDIVATAIIENGGSPAIIERLNSKSASSESINNGILVKLADAIDVKDADNKFASYIRARSILFKASGSPKINIDQDIK